MTPAHRGDLSARPAPADTRGPTAARAAGDAQGSPLPRRGHARVARPDGPGGRLSLLRVAGRGGDPTAFFAEVARRYPRIAYLRMASEHVYVLSAPDLVQAMLTTWGRVTVKGRGLERARWLLGDGLLTSEGDLHRRQRRLIQPAFHARRIEAYAQVMVARSAALRDRWQPGRRVDMAEEMSGLTLQIVGETLFGSATADATREVREALSTILSGFERLMLPGSALLMRLPLRSNRRLLDAGERLDAVVERLVAQRRAAGGNGADLLGMLLAASEGGVGMSDQQVRDEALTLLLAGHETTANALTWAWYLLSTNPQASGWLRAELAGLPAGRPLGLADLPSLPRTTAVVAEAMRLYPPAWLLGRRLTADVHADGWTLPAGSLVVTSQWALHRDPRWWAEPLEFRPERWLDATGAFEPAAPGQPRYAYLPFGAGSRQCIGEAFAWAEGTLALAVLAGRFDPRYAGPRPPGTRPAITLRPAGPMPMTLRLAG